MGRDRVRIAGIRTRFCRVAQLDSKRNLNLLNKKRATPSFLFLTQLDQVSHRGAAMRTIPGMIHGRHLIDNLRVRLHFIHTFCIRDLLKAIPIMTEVRHALDAYHDQKREQRGEASPCANFSTNSWRSMQ